MELAYSDPASPRALAFAIALYSYVALFGMAAFGRDTWEASGEGFAVMYRYLSRIAPLHVEDGRIRLRWPLTGLAGGERVPGSVAFVAVMLGSVLFDGYSRTTTWQDLAARVESPYVVDHPTARRAPRHASQPRRAADGRPARRPRLRGRLRRWPAGR